MRAEINMRALRAVLTVALLCTSLVATAFARTTAFPAEAACTVPSATSVIYADAREQVAQTSRGPLAYYRFGHGSPLLLVTGFRATLSEWNAMFLSELARHHDVVVFDNRGVGRSIPNASTFTVEDMAHDTQALIDGRKLHRPTVVGWSMGGAIVQQLAIDDPHAIGRMVLLSTLAPGPGGVPVPPDIQAKLSGAPGVTFDDIMGALFPPSGVAEAERCFRQEMYRPGDYHPPGISSVVTEGQSTLLAAWSGDDKAEALLPKVHIPALILSGTDDDIVSVRNSEALRHLLPRSRLLTIGEAGNAMM
jgi:pimeloyl-ACP methyl ester carboxylesterase